MARNIFAVINSLSAAVEELRTFLAPFSVTSAPPAVAAASAPTKRRPGRTPKAGAAVAAPAPAAPKQTAKRKAASPKEKAIQKLRGQFGFLIGRTPESARAKIYKIRDAKGYEAAIKAAKRVQGR